MSMRGNLPRYQRSSCHPTRVGQGRDADSSETQEGPPERTLERSHPRLRELAVAMPPFEPARQAEMNGSATFQIVRTLTAFGPLSPASDSYSTRAPSASER